MLQNADLATWTNQSTENNTVICWVDSVWLYLFSQIVRHDLFYHNTWVVEQTAIDHIDNTGFVKHHSRVSLATIYYSYFSKIRTLVISNTPENTSSSIDGIFKNCNWLEREVGEMYGLLFFFKTDSRKLLLDYSKIEHPLLKDFPSEGLQDVFYDLLDNQVSIVGNETTEL